MTVPEVPRYHWHLEMSLARKNVILYEYEQVGGTYTVDTGVDTV